MSRDVYGADDLDAYGNWVPSQYGQVWNPTPPVADWSPYSYGHWVWEGYYGWTWVDYAPWGWAPYHYGRWFWNTGVGWCWWPGARLASYFWNPALVGFFGWGGIGIGLGWVALAPFELFHPWWGGRLGFGWRGGFGNYRNGNLAGIYRNAAIRGGAMTTAYNSFGRSNQRYSPATRGQLTGATPFHGQMPVSPTRASYQFSNRAANANPRLASAANRQFFQHQQFGNRGGFSNAQRGSFTQPGSHGFAPNSQGAYAGRNSYSAAPRTSGAGGWQRFGDPGTSNGLRQGFMGGQEASGWHRFGQPPPSASANSRPGNQYSGNYQSRPLGMNGYNAGRPAYSAPRYNSPATPRYNYSAPSAPRYSAPATQRYSAPATSGGNGGSSRGGGPPRTSGGSSHGGGGGHSSSGGHHGR